MMKLSERKLISNLKIFQKKMRVLPGDFKLYLGGFVDGEGYIGITKTKRQNGSEKYNPTISFGTTQKWHTLWMYSILNMGFIYELRKHLPTREKNCWYIRISRYLEVKTFLEAMNPYLKLKKEQGELLLEFLNRWFERKKLSHRKTFRLPSPVDLIDSEKIYLKLKQINKKGISYEKSNN